MRFLSSSALAKAPKLRLAASCSAAETICLSLGPIPRVPRGLTPTWDRRPIHASAPSALAVPTRRGGLFVGGGSLRLGRLGLLGGRLLALGLVGRQHLPFDQGNRPAGALHRRLGAGSGMIDSECQLGLE